MKTKLLHRIRCHARSLIENKLAHFSVSPDGSGKACIPYGPRFANNHDRLGCFSDGSGKIRISALRYQYDYGWAFDGLLGMECGDGTSQAVKDAIFREVFKKVWEKEKPKYAKGRKK